MSLRVMTACISMSDIMFGLGAGLGASETTMSKEILKWDESLMMWGSIAVCLKKAVRGYGTVCHLLSSVWYVIAMSL